ncbi:MAG: sensor histidine kinase [Pseudomonadota bacterium]
MKSIRTKLTLWLIVPLALVASAVAVETFLSSKKVSNKLHDETLLTAMLAISENVIASNGDLLTEDVLELLTEKLGDQFFYHLAGPNNGFVTGYSDLPETPRPIELQGGVPVFYNSFYKGDPVRVVTMHKLISERELNGWVTITTWRRTSQRLALTYDLFSTSIVRFLVLVVAAGGIVSVAIRFGLKPLDNLRDAIERRDSQDLTPIKREMPVELAGIVKETNALFARVARSKTNRERFIGDAAHQLRNPLAALKTQAQAALLAKSEDEMREGLKRVAQTADHTCQLTQQMLASAGANALDVDQAPVVDIAALLERIARDHARDALEKDQSFSLDGTDQQVCVKGNSVLLQEALANLIDNAIKHNEEGASINVSVKREEDDRSIAIGITDSGAMMTVDEFSRLTQPFATGKTGAGGSGLGLAIAREVARAHKGELFVRPTRMPEGKEFVLRLPSVLA